MSAEHAKIVVYTSAGVELRAPALQRARTRLEALGFHVQLDPSVRLRHQRFGGTDAQRLETLKRVAHAAPSIAMACRGGYGMTRLLDAVDWKAIARSVARGTRWIGYSDMTALQMGLLAHTGAARWPATTLAGPTTPAASTRSRATVLSRRCRDSCTRWAFALRPVTMACMRRACYGAAT
jgi:muramoyltetrapeptide carboxypeptidase LdcA involved in peptidoglycan recycling